MALWCNAISPCATLSPCGTRGSVRSATIFKHTRRSVVLNLLRDMTVMHGQRRRCQSSGKWWSASDLPKESQLAEALQRGYNVIAVTFSDTLGADGSFQFYTELGPPLKKSEISRTAGVSGDSWHYILRESTVSLFVVCFFLVVSQNPDSASDRTRGERVASLVQG